MVIQRLSCKNLQELIKTSCKESILGYAKRSRTKYEVLHVFFLSGIHIILCIAPCRLASCVLLCRLLEIAESVSSLHIYRLMPSYILLPSCLIPWNRAKSTSFQSRLHDVMVREKSVIIIFLFAVRNSYVSEFYCIR